MQIPVVQVEVHARVEVLRDCIVVAVVPHDGTRPTGLIDAYHKNRVGMVVTLTDEIMTAF